MTGRAERDVLKIKFWRPETCTLDYFPFQVFPLNNSYVHCHVHWQFIYKILYESFTPFLKTLDKFKTSHRILVFSGNSGPDITYWNTYWFPTRQTVFTMSWMFYAQFTLHQKSSTDTLLGFAESLRYPCWHLSDWTCWISTRQVVECLRSDVLQSGIDL